MPRTDSFQFDEPDLSPTNEPWDFPLERVHKRRRVALSTTLVVLFFAGAAFTAGAGDLAANKLQANDPCTQQANAPLAADETCTSTPTTDAAAPTDPVVAEPAPAATPEPAAAPVEDVTPEPASVGSTARAAVVPDPAAPQLAAQPVAAAASAPATPPVLKAAAAPTVAVPLKRWAEPLPKHGAVSAPELDGGAGTPTIWLNRLLPDPTPPAKRLTGAFATRLASDAKAAGVDWALVLGVLRASGETRPAPANAGELSRLSSRLAALGGERDAWASALALDGHTEFADQAAAFARYDRAVGLWALVHGLEASKQQLTDRVLADPAVSIYAGGRDDLAKGRVDVRVVALIAYLRETFGAVTVTSLVSGHRLYARPNVISAHVYGRALDIAGLGSTPILGNQQPGGLTEHAVRDILLLPSELQPRQVISLLGLGGPSFPLADHYDHIHVGY